MLKNIILNNPLRSLGLTATNSYREFQERIDEVEAFKAIGQYPTYDSDFSFLDTFVRDEKIINLSKELVTNKVELNKYSLFWFSNSDDVDSMALDFIANGKNLSAKELWDNSTDNYNHTKNLALLLFIESLYISYNNEKSISYNNEAREKNLYLSIGKWIELCTFKDFIDDYKELLNSQNADKFILDILFKIIQPHFKVPFNRKRKFIYFDPVNIFEIISNTHKELAQYLRENYLKEYFNKIDELYNDHEKNKDRTNAKIHLDYLDEISDYINFIRKINKSELNNCRLVCDKVAIQLNRCSISIWNKNVDTIKKTDKLYKDIDKIKSFALKIAVGNTVKNDIKEGQATQKQVFENKKENERYDKILKPVPTLMESFMKLEELTSPTVSEIKKIIYNNRSKILKVKSLLDHDEEVVVETAQKCLRGVGTLSNNKSTNNYNISEGPAIEIMDMCRRINRDLNGVIIDYEWEQHLESNRAICLSNIQNQDLGLTSGFLGGAIRMIKKNTSCGCGSGAKEVDCCSVPKS